MLLILYYKNIDLYIITVFVSGGGELMSVFLLR